jgi:two-component system sensor histidine kinase FlrB
MLPSSHFLLIDDPPRGREREVQPHHATSGPAAPEQVAPGLASAFSEFIAVSSRLESSYRDLQQEVSRLKMELSRRREALMQSQTENERMRLALQQIVDSMPCGVLVAGAQGRVVMLNPEARRLLGAAEDFPLGTPHGLQQLAHGSGLDLASCAADEERGEMTQEFCLHHADAVRWVEVRNRWMIDTATGSKDQSILILRDVTAHNRAEEEREAGRNAMARAELAGVLAHEIRNPLASLELFSELIEKDEKSRGQWISHLRAGLRMLSATVNNVLSFQEGEFALSSIDLGSAIGNALDFVRPMLAQAHIALETPPAPEPVWILGNRAALQQVILNLASNAVRHSPPGGWITVRIERRRSTGEKQGAEVVVKLADSGCGIPPDLLEQIFEPGFSDSGETSGLGLTVCRRIMSRHGGQITAGNGADGGALFTLTFPALEAESERP